MNWKLLGIGTGIFAAGFMVSWFIMRAKMKRQKQEADRAISAAIAAANTAAAIGEGNGNSDLTPPPVISFDQPTKTPPATISGSLGQYQTVTNINEK